MAKHPNIESDQAYKLASELASITGESLADGLTEAIRQRLERERVVRFKEVRIRRILMLPAEIGVHLKEPVSSDHSWLYDDIGLPT